MEMEIVKRNDTQIIQTVDDLSRIGKMMSISGYFADARDAAQASVKIMAGMEMGFGAFTSMTGIHIIQGRPSVGANLMASAVKSNPRYDYRVREMSEQVCRIEYFEIVAGKRESIGVSEFTMADAKKAQTKNLDKFPRNMLFARAMSNGIRWFCPDVFSGNTVYTPEELGADVDEDGEPIRIETPTVEAEVIQPEQKPEKKVWDENKYLLEDFRVPDGLPAMNPNHALNFASDSGPLYRDMSVKELRGHWYGLAKKYREESDQIQRELIGQKISAIVTILQAKKEELQAQQQ